MIVEVVGMINPCSSQFIKIRPRLLPNIYYYDGKRIPYYYRGTNRYELDRFLSLLKRDGFTLTTRHESYMRDYIEFHVFDNKHYSILQGSVKVPTDSKDIDIIYYTKEELKQKFPSVYEFSYADIVESLFSFGTQFVYLAVLLKEKSRSFIGEETDTFIQALYL